MTETRGTESDTACAVRFLERTFNAESIMKKRSAFQIVDVADEHLAVAVGPDASSFNGVVVLSEPASFLLKNKKTNC